MSQPFTERTAWARNLAAPVRDFLSTESGGAVVLLGATVAALLWANSPVAGLLRVGLDHGALDPPRQRGHLARPAAVGERGPDDVLLPRRRARGQARARHRHAAGAAAAELPLAAALGGMAVPVLIYLAFNAGGPGAHGWGAAMSTDTAFALGVLALVAPRATRLRVRLLTLVVFDDLVALLVIATVYTERRRARPARRSPSASSARWWRCASPRPPGAAGRARSSASACGPRCSSRASIR